MLITLLKNFSRRVNLKRNLTTISNSNLQTTTVSERLKRNEDDASLLILYFYPKRTKNSLGVVQSAILFGFKWNHKQFCAQKGMEDQMFKGVTPQKFLSGFEMKVLKIIFEG